MVGEVERREARGQLNRIAAVAGLLAGAMAVAPHAALAQSHGGGGGHASGGGGGYHGAGGYQGGGDHGGGFHGGGDWHGGGGWHGGDWHGGDWHGGGWRGGWGGWYGGGFYPGFGFGYDAFYDPFWAYGPYGYSGFVTPYYSASEADVVDSYVAMPPAAAPDYGQQAYGSQGSVGVTPGSGTPTDNSRGFYRWPVGIQGGACNRDYLQRTASNLTAASLRTGADGAFLGGISVSRVVGGRIGPRLDMSDQACATESLELAQTGRQVAWQTAEGVPITFQVTRTLEQGASNCRDYVVTAQFASQTDTVRGKACKQPNGSWVAAR